ncbi:MAG: hypothetical protein PQJ59_15895 [Spirochaetales bacterium]|nr:hypothetical protein [Spirochaetales bacterium]
MREEEVAILEGYGDFLSVFYNHIDRVDKLDDYRKIDLSWQSRLKSIQKVLRGLKIDTHSPERTAALERCQSRLKKLMTSLDRKRCSLHDDISSLNKENCRMGLRYNRYDSRSAHPGLIDITT